MTGIRGVYFLTFEFIEKEFFAPLDERRNFLIP
jgi:hypothetical protein